MDTVMIMNFRNLLLLGVMLTTTACVPSSTRSARMHFRNLALRFKRWRASLRSRRPENRQSFWEIDLTKLEP